MRSKIKKILQSTKKEKTGNSQKQNLQSQADSISWKYYHSISKLPLKIFIKCLCDKDPDQLIIKGKPPKEELTQAWVNILQEYSDAVGSNEHKLYLSLYREVSLLKINFDLTEVLIEILELEDTQFWKDELNKIHGTQFRFGEEKHNDLRRIASRNKALKVQIDLKLIQFNEIEKKHRFKQEEPANENYYNSILITLSDHAKYQILDSITVFEFCERIKRLNKYYETLKNKK